MLKRMNYKIFQISYRCFSRSVSSSQKAVQLAYNTAIPKTGDSLNKCPLLIFHGLFGSKINWKSVSSQLAQRTKREIFAFDLRNHGDSPHTLKEDCTLRLMAKDIEHFMDGKGLKQAALLGHSLGGIVCSQFAFYYPDRVEKLILADISPLAKTPKSEFLDSSLFIKLRDSISIDLPSNTAMPNARKIVGERLMEKVNNKFVVDFLLLSLYKTDDGKFKWKFCLDSLDYMLNSKQITKIDIPNSFNGETLIIHGAKSKYVVEENYPEILEKMPNSKFVCLEGAGHHPHVEKPTEFIENVVTFLR